MVLNLQFTLLYGLAGRKLDVSVLIGKLFARICKLMQHYAGGCGRCPYPPYRSLCSCDDNRTRADKRP